MATVAVDCGQSSYVCPKTPFLLRCKSQAMESTTELSRFIALLHLHGY